MGQTVDRDGEEAGVAEDDLVLGSGGGVAVVCGLDVGLDQGPDPGNGIEERQAHLFRPFRCPGGLRAVGLEHQGGLAVEVVHHILDQHGQVVLDIIEAVGFVPVEAGIDDSQQLLDHIGDDCLVGVAEQVDLVDVPVAVVVAENGVDDGFDLLFDQIHENPSFWDGYTIAAA